MSVAYYIVPERKINGFDHFVNGKALAHADEETLEKLCTELKVKPITEFISQDPEELADFFEAEGIDLPDELPTTDWFEPSVGLMTVRALASYLQENPNTLKDSADIVEDLREYESVLTRLESENVRWYLALDY